MMDVIDEFDFGVGLNCYGVEAAEFTDLRE